MYVNVYIGVYCGGKESVLQAYDAPLPVNQHTSDFETLVQVTNETTMGATRRLVSSLPTSQNIVGNSPVTKKNIKVRLI